MSDFNYFILLKIKPDASKIEIEEAINKLDAQWKKDKNSSRTETQNKAKQYLNEEETIKQVLLDWGNNPSARMVYSRQKKEAERIIEEKEENLRVVLKAYDQLTDSDIEALLGRNSIYWLDNNEVRSLFEEIKADASGSGTQKREFHKDDYLDKEVVHKIQSYMHQIPAMATKENATLYDFLKVRQSTSAKDLLKLVKERLADASGSGKQNVVGAEKSLYALCEKEIFATPETKKKYDRYIEITKYPAANDIIDIKVGPKKNQPFTQKSAEDFITAVWEAPHIKMPVRDALEYLRNYCAYNEYPLENLDEEALISKYSDTQSQEKAKQVDESKQNDMRQEEALRKLRQTLTIGQSAAKDIQDKQEEIKKLNGGLKENITKSENEKVKLIAWAIVHAVVWVCALFVTELINSNVLEGLWVFLMVVLMIISAVCAIRALVSMLSYRHLGTKTPEEQDAENKIMGEINQIKEEKRDYLVLEDPYTFDPKSYQTGLDYVNKGTAVTIEELNELLRNTSS